MKLEITGHVTTSDLPGQPVHLTEATPVRSSPISGYGASISLEQCIAAGLSGRVGSLRGSIYHLRNAKIIVGGENSSLILTEDNKLVLEPSCFTSVASRQSKSYPVTIDVLSEQRNLYSLAVGFDRAWNNYYHWLLFAIGRGRFAQSQIDPIIPIGVPAYNCAMGDIRFSADTYRASLDGLMAGRPVIELEEGLYHIENLYFFWTHPYAPTDSLEFQSFLAPFCDLGKAAIFSEDNGNARYYFSRAKASESRIMEQEAVQLDEILAAYAFETIFLETLSFKQQVELAANAKVILAPHGAGLTNLIFSNPDTKIIELNRRLHGESIMRPWFYQLASLKNLSYLGIDMDRDDKYDTLRSALHDMLHV